MAEAEVQAEVAVVTPEGPRRRRRLEVSRERLTVRLSAEELAEIGVAARRAGADQERVRGVGGAAGAAGSGAGGGGGGAACGGG